MEIGVGQFNGFTTYDQGRDEHVKGDCPYSENV